MFWWLYGTSLPSRETAPFVLWLQGGPGASGTGYGNFGEFGPLDINLNPRNTTWLQSANLLFVDNPVGAGVSFVDDLSLLPKDNAAIAADLVTLLTAFVAAVPEAATAPFFVFSESYGGKMTIQLADALTAAIAGGSLTMNLRGVALGDSWISGIDYVDTWAPFLRATSLMTETDKASIVDPLVAAADAAVAAGDWAAATSAWGAVEGGIDQATPPGINFCACGGEKGGRLPPRPLIPALLCPRPTRPPSRQSASHRPLRTRPLTSRKIVLLSGAGSTQVRPSNERSTRRSGLQRQKPASRTSAADESTVSKRPPSVPPPSVCISTAARDGDFGTSE